MNTLLFLVTGGTLDKDYNALTGELGFHETHLPQMLKQANITLEHKIDCLLLKDSLEMTDKDREKIWQAVNTSQAKYIVITHGTDTMTTSANYLAEQFRNKGLTNFSEKTIVLTGAMRPYKLGDSDALFNLGAATIAAQTFPAGIFITMNGKVFNAGEVQKNLQKGQFEPV